MADIQFVDGLIVKAPRDGAPDFVKATISIKVADLKKWLSGQTDEWVNVDVKESKNGKWYAAVSTFKPKEGKPKSDKRDDSDIESDIPF